MLRGLVSAAARLTTIALWVGCGGSGDDEEPNPPAPTVSCREDARLDHSADMGAGELAKVGELGVLSFRFFDLEPAPPAKGNNTFHIELELVAGGAAESAGTVLAQSELRVDLRMPDHGHGTSVEPVVTPDPASDVMRRGFVVAPLYLFMPGVWRLEFEAFDASTGDGSAAPAMIDRAVLHFCIEG